MLTKFAYIRNCSNTNQVLRHPALSKMPRTIQGNPVPQYSINWIVSPGEIISVPVEIRGWLNTRGKPEWAEFCGDDTTGLLVDDEKGADDGSKEVQEEEIKEEKPKAIKPKGKRK